jgi:hypothetical protein
MECVRDIPTGVTLSLYLRTLRSLLQETVNIRTSGSKKQLNVNDKYNVDKLETGLDFFMVNPFG